MNFGDIEAKVMALQPEYPADRSLAGTNAFSHFCEPCGWKPNYAVCLNKIQAYERDGELKSYPDCDKAIARVECPALEKRQEEREAGKALFYLDRQLLQKTMDEDWAKVMESFDRTAPKTGKQLPSGIVRRPHPAHVNPMPATQPTYADAITKAVKAVPRKEALKPEPSIAMPTFADAINAAMRDAQAPTQKTVLLPMLPGESVAEYAARVNASRKESA